MSVRKAKLAAVAADCESDKLKTPVQCINSKQKRQSALTAMERMRQQIDDSLV